MKIYVVIAGRVPGIYNSWDECQKQTSGVSGAVFKSFKSYSEAQQYINENSSQQQINPIAPVTPTIPISRLTISQPFTPVKTNETTPSTPILPIRSNSIVSTTPSTPIVSFTPVRTESTIPEGNVIYVDGGCNSHTEGNAWGSVVNKDGIDLIEPYYQLLHDMKLEKRNLPNGPRCVIVCKFDDVPSQQNNGGELLAMVAGLRIAIYCIQNGMMIPAILSDSKLIVEYWSKRVTPGKTYDPLKLQFIQYCISLRQYYESLGGKIIKISGDINLADLYWHVSKRK